MARGIRAMRMFESDVVLETDITQLSCEYLYTILMTGGRGGEPLGYQAASKVVQEKHGEYISYVRFRRHVHRYLVANAAVPYPPSIHAKQWASIEQQRRGSAEPQTLDEGLDIELMAGVI